MALISSTDLAKLRSKNHQAQIFGTFMSPPILWTARVNGNQTMGEVDIPFNSGSGTNFNLIEAEQEVWIGSTSGSREHLGRIRSISSGDGGVTGTVTIAGNWYTLNSGDYLTFTLNYPLKPKYPLLAGTPEVPLFYKDQNITYTNQNSNLHPVVIAGGNRAGFASLVVNPHLELSYTMTPSATITNFSATSLSLDGGTPTISINSSTGVGTITFTTPGQYWIKYTITDSNGQVQNSYRYYYAHSTDPTNQHYPDINFTVNSIQGDWDSGGWNAGIKFHGDCSDIVENTIGIIWQVAKYNNEATNIGFSNNTLISGYLVKENIGENIFTDIGSVDFSLVTIQSLLQNHYMFSISLEARSSPSDWYQFRNELTCLRGVHHFWKWHSTLMEICDVVGLNRDTDMLRPFVELEDGTLYTMADNLIRNEGIRYHVVCDKNGVISTTPEIQLLTDAERAVIPEVFEIEYNDRSEEIVLVRETRHRVVLTKVSGFSWDGTFQANPDLCPNIAETGIPCPNSTPYCSESPNRIPDDEGANTFDLDRQTLRSQSHCNEIAGRLFGQLNLEYTEIRVNFHGNYSGVLDVAYPYFWKINVQAVDSIRGIVLVDQPILCRNVSLSPNVETGIITVSAVFEPESDTYPGIPGICLDELPPEEGTPTGTSIIPQTGGIPLVTGSSVWFKPGYSNTWDLRSNEDVRDLRVDPFWKTRQGTSDPERSIIWRCGAAYIKRSIDGGKNWTDVTPFSGLPNDAADTPAPTVPDLVFEHMDVSWVNQGEYVFLAYWLNNSIGSPTFGEYRTWIVWTDDDGATWTWQSISVDGVTEDYDTDGLTNTIGYLFEAFATTDESQLVQFSQTSTSQFSIGVFDIDDNIGSTQVGTTHNVTLNQPIISDVYKINDVRYIISYYENSGANSYIDIIEVDLTDGTVSTLDSLGFVGKYWFKVAEMSTGQILAVSVQDTGGTFQAIKAHHIEFSGGTLSLILTNNLSEGMFFTDRFSLTLTKLTSSKGLITNAAVSGISLISFDDFPNISVMTLQDTVGLTNLTALNPPRIRVYDSARVFITGGRLFAGGNQLYIYAVTVTGVTLAISDTQAVPINFVKMYYDVAGYRNSRPQADFIINTVDNKLELLPEIGFPSSTIAYLGGYLTCDFNPATMTMSAVNEPLMFPANRLVYRTTKLLAIWSFAVRFYPLIIPLRYPYKQFPTIANSVQSMVEVGDYVYMFISGLDTATETSMYQYDKNGNFVATGTIPTGATNQPIVYDSTLFGGVIFASVRYNSGNAGEIWYYDGSWHLDFTITVDANPTQFLIYGGSLYVGLENNGHGASFSHLIKREGLSWTNVDSTGDVEIICLEEFDGQIYAGRYDNVGFTTRLSYLDGVNWVDVVNESASTGFRITDLEIFDGNLYFNMLANIYYWDGLVSTSIGTGTSRTSRLKSFNGKLYFTDSSGVVARTYVWDGLTVDNVGFLPSSIVGAYYSMCVSTHNGNPALFVGSSYPAYDSTANLFIIVEPLATTYQVFPLGLSKHKTLTEFYATYLGIDTQKIYLGIFDDSLVKGQETIFGQSLVKQNYDTRRIFLYPLGAWDGKIFAYGRFYNPTDLSDVVHIMYSEDSGVTWQIYIGNWASDHCGGMFESINGNLFAVRNNQNGVQGKLYVNGIIRQTLPFNAGINPHSIDLDYSGTVYLCSQNNLESIMVVRIPYPYNGYGNITYNHGNTEGVYSIQVLD